MDVTLRPGRSGDAEACGPICYLAFKTIAEAHGFPPDFPTPEMATGLLASLFSLPHLYAVVAERNGRVVGSCFLWEGGPIAGIGPITVDPEAQNATVGRRLMEHVLERCRGTGVAGVRLVQAAYHNRSLALYTKLGFDAREPLSMMRGGALGIAINGYTVRPASREHRDACNDLCVRIHGHDREPELMASIREGAAMVVERGGRVTGYATKIGILGHAVGESNDDLKALIGAAPAIEGPGFLLPTRNGDLLRWCLGHGLRVLQPATLMSQGLYNEPRGAFLPSILY